MSGKGRGALLSLKTEATFISIESTNSSEGVSVRDSGLGSRSPASVSEYRRVGRGKLLDELTSSCSNLSFGRGQSNSKNESVGGSHHLSTTESNEKSLRGGRGRAQVFMNLFADSIESVVANETSEFDVGEERKSESGDVSFFNPKTRHGVKGTPMPLTCNYIRLCSDPDKGVYVYEVRFKPNVDSTNLRVKYLNQHLDKLGGTKTFDGVTLYLPILLKEKLTTFVSKSITDDSNVEVRILYKRKESLKNCIHLYNVLFDRIMKALNFVRFDRKQFDPTAPKIIPQAKLEVWPGYVTAVDEYEGGLMLCCDISHRLLCQKTVRETLIEIYQANAEKFQENAKKYLLGSVVITRYNNRTYRIDDICFDKTPASKFQTKDSEISYLEYYRRNHNIEIKDENQPLLISIKKQKCSSTNTTNDFVFCLIPEICYLTGLRDDIRSDYKLMREIATFTRVSPNQRILALEKFYNNVNNSPEALKILSSWGLSLKQSCEHITGRQFDEEQIVLARKTVSAGPTADFGKYVTNNELLEVVHLRNWLLLHCKNDMKFAKYFCDHLDRNAGALGIQIQKPKMIVLDNDRVETYVKELRNNLESKTQIVVCICPTSRDDRYAAIKKVCCTEIPVPSQVINARTLLNETKNRSIVQKIALQMNCKLGGSLWSVKIPFKNVMICGVDSYHDAAQKGNSVAAFVASLNSSYTKWYSKAVIQTKREEIVSGLCASFTSAIIAFEKENGKLPDNVIIYRDGVGDGQLQLCASYEISQMEAACAKLFRDYVLKITFVVVQKRINTRFFLSKGRDASNPPPGTLVDDVITRANLYDFFLVSQSVRQGTVSPTHYVVLRDDAAYSPDIIQRLSYKLCFMYYNWPGTIRIPACCQYAHKMAYLVGQSIRRITSEELANKLFYL